jgi:hypothetical protein
LRPLAVFLVLPFALLAISRPRRRVGFMAVLLLPIIAVSAGNTLYDFHAFGAWSSTGYHFWRSIPYDYPSLVFSPWFLTQNLMVLWTFKGAAMILALAFVGWLSLKKQPPDDLRHYLRYALLAAGPISFIHLWYAWTTVRFHFVGLALLVVLAAAGIARWIPQSVQRQKWLLVAALAVSPVFPPRMRIPLPVRRQLGEQIARLTPADAVIVSAIPAPFLETLISQPGNHRLIVPPDRQWKDDVYANMIINTANARVDPLAASDANGRAALIAQGASYVHPFTADEGMDQLSA